jgi:hypothetical protein
MFGPEADQFIELAIVPFNDAFAGEVRCYRTVLSKRPVNTAFTR